MGGAERCCVQGLEDDQRRRVRRPGGKRPADDTAEAPDRQQTHWPDPATEPSDHGEQDDLRHDPDRPKRPNETLGQPLRLPVQRAEGVVNRMAGLDRPVASRNTQKGP